MESLPAGEFQLELSSSGTEMASEISTELDSPDVIEISSESEVEILNAKIAQRLPAHEELRRMKDHERYGYLYRLQDKQAKLKAKLKHVKEDIENESKDSRQTRRKSFQKAVLGLDSQDLQ